MNRIILGQIINISKGKKHLIVEYPKKSSIRVIRITDLRNDNNLRYTDDDNGTEVNTNDIIIAWDGANAGTIGYGKSGYIGSTIARLRLIEGEKYYPLFLGLFLKSKFRYLKKTSTGAAIPHVSRKALEGIEIPPIEYNDQVKIATILNKAEKLLKERKESILLLDELLKSKFLEMFGHSADGFNDWIEYDLEKLLLKEKGSIRTGPFGSDLKHSEFVDKGIAVIGIDNAVQNKFTWGKRRFISLEKYKKLERYTLSPNDVIITIMGTTGRSAVIPEDIPLSINTKHLAAITLDSNLANPYFISYSIHSNPYIKWQIERMNKGAIIPGLNLRIIKKLKITKPPIKRQNKFAEIVEKVESIKAKYEASLVEIENLFGSLSQQAFNGELVLSKIPIPFKHSVSFPIDTLETKEFKQKLPIEIERTKKLTTTEISSITSDATVVKPYTKEELIRAIKAKSGITFSFIELWQYLKESYIDLQDKEAIYTDFIECLSTGTPIIEQVFEYLSSDNGNDKQEKQIAFRVLYDN